MAKEVKSYRLDKENSDWLTSQGELQTGGRSASWYLNDLITRCRMKVESKAKPPAVKQEIQYPSELNVEAWNEWKAYRRENKMKAYKPTPRSEGVAVNNLIKLSKGDHHTQLLIVQQSMANTWTGLFEVKGNETNKQQNATDGMSATKRAMLEARRERDSAKGGSSLGFNDRDIHGQMGEEEWNGRIIDMD